MEILVEKGGKRGKSDGSKVVKPVVHALIAPEFLPLISWTGRGNGKERKIALKKYTQIINLIVQVLKLADTNFDEAKTLQNLKYKIIKPAPANYGSKEKSSHNVDTNCSTVNGTVSK